MINFNLGVNFDDVINFDFRSLISDQRSDQAILMAFTFHGFSENFSLPKEEKSCNLETLNMKKTLLYFITKTLSQYLQNKRFVEHFKQFKIQ